MCRFPYVRYANPTPPNAVNFNNTACFDYPNGTSPQYYLPTKNNLAFRPCALTENQLKQASAQYCIMHAGSSFILELKQLICRDSVNGKIIARIILQW